MNKLYLALGTLLAASPAYAQDCKTLKNTLKTKQVIGALEEGQSKTYTLDRTAYEVTAAIIDDYVKMKINNEVSAKITKGGTATLSNGLTIHIKDIKQGNLNDRVDFVLGNLDTVKTAIAADYVCNNGKNYADLKSCLDESKTSSEASLCRDAVKIKSDFEVLNDDLDKMIDLLESSQTRYGVKK